MAKRSDETAPVAQSTVPRQLNFARAGGLLLALELAGVVVGFGSTVYFANRLGAAPLGAFFLFEALLGTVGTFTNFGINGAVEKRISEGEDPDAVLSAAIVLKLGLMLALVAALLPFRAGVNSYVGAPVVVPLVVGTGLAQGASLTVHVLRGELRAGETAVLQFLRLVTYVAVAVVLVELGGGALALVYGLLAGYAVVVAVGALRVETGLARPSRAHLGTLVDYAKFNGIWGLGGQLYNTMDVLVIGFFLSSVHVAGYELAWRLTVMAGLVGTVVANTVFAQMSAWDATGQRERITPTVRDGLAASLVLVVPSLVGVALLSEEILGLVFGPEFVLAAAAMVVLMGEKAVAAVNTVFDAAVRAIDRPDVGAYATVASLTLNVVLNVALVPAFGLVGAAVATGLSMVANTVVLWWSLGRAVPLAFPTRAVAWFGAGAAVMGGALLATDPLLPPTLPGLVGQVLLGGVVYVAVLSLSPALRADGRAFVERLG